jgi:hypothetical protein
MTLLSATRIVALVLLAAAAASPQDRRVTPMSGSGRRFALIIGNDAYPWKPLKNAVNDARDLAAELPRIGFAPENISLVTDANLLAMQKAGIEFLQKLRADDLAFVFYSGHGVEVRGENYLVPVDFPADATELDVQYRAFSAQQFLRNLEASPARARIMILDACRDNPLRAARSASGGLARMDGSGTLIVFATGSGRTADDNVSGRNGLFTSHLLRALPTPGITVDDLMRQVARDVNRDSAGKQTPALYGLLLEDFTLAPGSAPATGGARAPGPSPVDASQEAWDLVKNSNNPEDLDDFAKQFPSSDRVPVARLRAAQLRRTSQTPAPRAESASAGLIGKWRGPNGKPFLFTGNGGVGLPFQPEFDLPNGSAWTLAAWVSPSDASSPQHIAGKRQGCGGGAGFYQLAIGGSQPGTGMSIDPSHTPVNTWTHVAIVADGINGFNVFANGAVVKRVRAPDWTVQNSGPFLIGGAGICRPFRGSIDDVRLYNRALSTAEVQALYAAGLPPQ